MMFKKESQFTSHASKQVFEEVYTNEDMADDRADVNNKFYMLRTPHMFAANVSQEKAISPRRILCEPKSHNFTMRISFYGSAEPEEGDEGFSTGYILYNFTSENTIEEILNYIRDKTRVIDDVDDVYQIEYRYNKITGKLSITASFETFFRFECESYEDYKELWSIFNQIGNPFKCADNAEYDYEVLTIKEKFDFENVWNRDKLYVHASFSSSKKQYLCRTNDFWFKPSKYYYDNITRDEFFIFFTTDGSNRIIPYDAIKIIELCFILRQFSRL